MTHIQEFVVGIGSKDNENSIEKSYEIIRPCLHALLAQIFS
jgi:hypothetical protein